MRIPSSATTHRNSVFTQNAMPDRNAARSANVFNATPRKSAITIADTGKTRVKYGSAATAVTATDNASAIPGASSAAVATESRRRVLAGAVTLRNVAHRRSPKPHSITSSARASKVGWPPRNAVCTLQEGERRAR
jgi:hypothetical protein